jgi:hypothetical protein
LGAAAGAAEALKLLLEVTTIRSMDDPHAESVTTNLARAGDEMQVAAERLENLFAAGPVGRGTDQGDAAVSPDVDFNPQTPAAPRRSGDRLRVDHQAGDGGHAAGEQASWCPVGFGDHQGSLIPAATFRTGGGTSRSSSLVWRSPVPGRV